MPRRPSAIVRSGAPFAMALAMASALACVSPTLPLPPPEAPMQTEGTDADHVRLTAGCGGAQGGANIFIINQTVETTAPDMAVGGSVASACGSWDANVFAHTGDVLAITQEADGASSNATVYNVR